MGCSQSQLRQLSPNTDPPYRHDSTADVVALQEEGLPAQDSSLSRPIDSSKENLKKGKVHGQGEQQGKIKVKKAKNYRIKPEHQRFIENIIESNRGKANTEYPSQPGSKTPLKKNPSSSMYNKIEDDKPLHVEAVAVEPVLCQKQRQKRLNLLPKIEQRQQIGQPVDLDSCGTLQL